MQEDKICVAKGAPLKNVSDAYEAGNLKDKPLAHGNSKGLCHEPHVVNTPIKESKDQVLKNNFELPKMFGTKIIIKTSDTLKESVKNNNLNVPDNASDNKFKDQIQKNPKENTDEVRTRPKEELGVKVQLAEAHSRVFDAFSRAFSRQNYQFEKAIRSLDSLNDQIFEFVLSEDTSAFIRNDENCSKQKSNFVPAVNLMRQLLVDAQTKFRKMVEENQLLASRIDSELQAAHNEVGMLRQDLADTNRRISEMQTPLEAKEPMKNINDGTNENVDDHKALEFEALKRRNELLEQQNKLLQKEIEEIRSKEVNDYIDDEVKLDHSEGIDITDANLEVELSHAKEALAALKADRKRLKAEKYDLLNQMKQLYATLEDKEKELRDFIRNYEQRMKESEESLRHLAAERDESEKEKWNLLNHARDEAERAVSLASQLSSKDITIRRLEEELQNVRKHLAAMVNGEEIIQPLDYSMEVYTQNSSSIPTPTPSVSTPTCSPLPLSVCTTNERGSSADSGVRLSSDKDSNASHDGGPCTPNREGSSIIYATPRTIYENAQVLQENIKRSGSRETTPLAENSDLANCGVTTLNLSRSAEQISERLSMETKKNRGFSTLSRKNNKSGTWGSISRVFARQKKRAALDNAIFARNQDKRASWSPMSSSCAFPLTEEGYLEKLRLLEEAQNLPLERWKAQTVLAWLEITLRMSQYGAMCAENVRSGKVLLELSDSDLESGLGITHPLHRKKLRLAIEELREPRMRRFPKISILNQDWVATEWLKDLGLVKYSDTFASCLIDGRMLDTLTKKELEKYLGVTRKLHQASIMSAINLLRIVHYDIHLLLERRRQSAKLDIDPLVWTNARFVKWARSIDLYEYADNLKESGIHGALVVLENSFIPDTMVTALGIPSSKSIIRKHLIAEFENLISPARKKVEEQAKYAKIERRRQETLSSESFGIIYSKGYSTLDRSDKNRKNFLMESLSKSLGLKVKDELIKSFEENSIPEHVYGPNNHTISTMQARPRSSIVTSTPYFLQYKENHRRVRSIGEINHIAFAQV